MKFEKISTFSLIIFVGMSLSSEALLALLTSKYFISVMISSFEIWLKVKTETLLVFCFIAEILGGGGCDILL